LASFTGIKGKRFSPGSTDDGRVTGMPPKEPALSGISVREPGRPGRRLPYLRPSCRGHLWPRYRPCYPSIQWSRWRRSIPWHPAGLLARGQPPRLPVSRQSLSRTR